MTENFNADSVTQYRRQTRTFFLKKSLKSESILAMFDKNHDRKISKSELQSISKEQYQQNIQTLKQNKEYVDFNEENDFLDYDDLSNFLDEGFISYEELSGLNKTFGLKEKNLEEIKNLKDPTQMSNGEIFSELSAYNIELSEDVSRKVLIKELEAAREERSNYDENSKVVDGHIGTFVQARDNAMCTVLAVLETMSDEQIQDMFVQKTDEQGKVYYEVTFPQDKNNGKSVIVTQEEIDNMAIKIPQENGTEREVINFSTGDADITMFEMAFVKRFGTDTFDNGSFIDVSRNVFSQDGQNFIRNQNVENIKNLENLDKNTTIALLTYDDIFKKGESIGEITLSDGRTARFYGGKLLISDGTEINSGHAMSVRKFDKDSNELVITGNSFNSISETRIPAELLKYFEITTPSKQA